MVLRWIAALNENVIVHEWITMKLCVVQQTCKEWGGSVPVLGWYCTYGHMECVCVPQAHTMGLRIQGEPLIVSLRLKTLLGKFVTQVQSSVLQCLELEPTKCLCVRLIIRAKNDATSSNLNALKLFRLVNSDIASSVLAYWPDVTHVHRNKVVCWNSKTS